MIIKVNKTNIREGKKCQFDSCPIALALKRTLGISKVKVDRTHVYFGKTKLLLSNEVQFFIEIFDSGEHVKPFEFEL